MVSGEDKVLVRLWPGGSSLPKTLCRARPLTVSQIINTERLDGKSLQRKRKGQQVWLPAGPTREPSAAKVSEG